MATVTTASLVEEFGEQVVAEALEAEAAQRARLPRWRRALLAGRDRLRPAGATPRPPGARLGLLRASTGVAASLGAAGCTVAGVHELAGTGWALLSAVPYLLLLERRLA